MAQPKSQLPLLLGLTAAGGVGYYLYTAGGNPTVAEKQFEGMYTSLDQDYRAKWLTVPSADTSKASAKVKGELPGRTKEAQKTGEAWASEAGAKIDSAVRFPHADPKRLLPYRRSTSKTSEITFIAPKPASAVSNSGTCPTNKLTDRQSPRRSRQSRRKTRAIRQRRQESNHEGSRRLRPHRREESLRSQERDQQLVWWKVRTRRVAF